MQVCQINRLQLTIYTSEAKNQQTKDAFTQNLGQF